MIAKSLGTFVGAVLCVMLGMGARDAGNDTAAAVLFALALGAALYMLAGGPARRQ